MVDVAARLVEILRKAILDHQATEASLLAEIGWLEREVRERRDDTCDAWGPRIDILRGRLQMCLGGYEDVLEAPPSMVVDQDLKDFECRIGEFDRQLEGIRMDMEMAGLRLVLQVPDILVGEYSPVPFRLQEMSKLMHAAKALFTDLAGYPTPTPVDLAVMLGDRARRLASDPDTAEDAPRAAAISVALLHCSFPAHPEPLRPRLGAALATLVQSHLACGDVERARAAAAEACHFVDLDDLPPEVQGLVDPATD